MKRVSLLLLAWTSASVWAATPAAPPSFAEAVGTGYGRWDTDKDGLLSADEVAWGLASPEVKGPEAAALASIFRASRSRSAALKLPISLADLQAKASPSSKAANLDDDRENANLTANYLSGYRRIAETPHQLFVNGTPRLDSFRQGKIGSCFCLAPFACLINQDPARVAARFTPTKDGFTVKLNDQRSVWVSTPTDGEIAISSNTGDDGYWSTVYEKAVGQMRIEDKGLSSPPLIAATAGSAGTMLSVLTGHPIKRFSCSPWRKADVTTETRAKKLDELRALLTENTKDHRLMTAGTGSSGAKVPSISSWHAYAVLSYDSANDLVTIRDPHGQTFMPKGTPGLENGYVVNKGIFEAPLGDVVQFMGGFAFEQKDGAAPEKGAETDTTPEN